MESLFTTENIIQGGGILIALVLAWIVYKLVTNHDHHLQGLVDRNTDAWIQNTSAITKLVDKLDNFLDRHEK